MTTKEKRMISGARNGKRVRRYKGKRARGQETKRPRGSKRAEEQLELVEQVKVLSSDCVM